MQPKGEGRVRRRESEGGCKEYFRIWSTRLVTQAARHDGHHFVSFLPFLIVVVNARHRSTQQLSCGDCGCGSGYMPGISTENVSIQHLQQKCNSYVHATVPLVQSVTMNVLSFPLRTNGTVFLVLWSKNFQNFWNFCPELPT